MMIIIIIKSFCMAQSLYNTGSVHLLKYSIIITTNKHTTADMIIKVLYIITS